MRQQHASRQATDVNGDGAEIHATEDELVGSDSFNDADGVDPDPVEARGPEEIAASGSPDTAMSVASERMDAGYRIPGHGARRARPTNRVRNSGTLDSRTSRSYSNATPGEYRGRDA